MIDYERFFSEESNLYRVSDIRKLLEVAKQKELISLGGGLPDFRIIDLKEVLDAVTTVIMNKGNIALQYSATNGEPSFIDALTEYLEKDVGLEVKENESIIVTTGSQQAIDITARLFLNPNDVLLLEKPTYVASLNAFFPRRPRFEGLEITSDDGISIDELESKLEKLKKEGIKPKVLYIIPSYQNPTGAILPEKSRRKIVELSHEYDFLVVEDDPYSQLTYEGGKPKPIKAFDEEGRVIYISTLSKVVSPGLRIGFVLADRAVINRYSLIKQALDLHSSTLTQLIAEELLRRGFHRKYLSKIIPIYRSRRDAMLRSLEEELGDDAVWTRPRGGMFVFVWLKNNIDTKKLLEKAIDSGVLYVPGSGFYYDGSGRNTMRLNFSYPSEEDIRKGIKILGELVKSEAERNG
jgi:2-aminoadipate transaminase